MEAILLVIVIHASGHGVDAGGEQRKPYKEADADEWMSFPTGEASQRRHKYDIWRHFRSQK